jgi:hypothetical protein
MNKTFARTGSHILLASMLLGLVSCSKAGEPAAKETLRLYPCSAEGSVFADEKFEKWKEIYHTNVSQVVDAHLSSIKEVSNMPLQCTEENYEQLVPATEQLRKMAGMLPAWREPERLASLNETDMGPVLLEFLRVYECSMKEREAFLTVTIQNELQEWTGIMEFEKKKDEEKAIMAKEIAVSRETLNRTLGIVSGYDRLRPLSLDIECLKRASLDLRNILGLASDASACLPRITDTHQSLRDLAD